MNRAAVRNFEPVDTAQQCRFSASGRSEQANRLALLHFERHIAQDMNAAERFGNPVQLKHGRGRVVVDGKQRGARGQWQIARKIHARLSSANLDSKPVMLSITRQMAQYNAMAVMKAANGIK